MTPPQLTDGEGWPFKMLSRVSVDRLKEVVSYNPDTGVFTWKRRPDDCRYNRTFNKVHAGKRALGTVSPLGYKHGAIDRQEIFAHRAAWAFVHGVWPQGEIDHINRNPGDNWIANLRLVDSAENGLNRSIGSNNKSGVLGVHKCSRSGRWIASIRRGGQSWRLGTFASFDEAVSARKAAEVTLGFHPNHGSGPSPQARKSRPDNRDDWRDGILRGLGSSADQQAGLYRSFHSQGVAHD